MPKEITHWYVASKVAEAVLVAEPTRGIASGGNSGTSSPYPGVARCLREAPNVFLLGSVGPDFLFYYLMGPELEAFRSAAMVLHGRDGGNTLRPLIAVAEAWSARMGRDPDRPPPGGPSTGERSGPLQAPAEPLKQFRPAVGAFLLGWMVHVWADSVFHPFVLHTVGKGEGRPQYEHHVLESALDLYVLRCFGNSRESPAQGKSKQALKPGTGPDENGGFWRDPISSFVRSGRLPTRLRTLTRGMEEGGELDRESFLRLLGLLSFLGQPYSLEALRTCLRRYELLQGWFWSPLACRLSQIVKTMDPSKAFFEASCYQSRFYRYAEAFGETLEYRHPVTGEGRSTSVQELVTETVERVLSQASPIESLVQALSGKGPSPSAGPLKVAQDLQGPNLETGLYGDKADTVLYARAEGLVELFGPYGYRYR